jgi:hypothetical protein
VVRERNISEQITSQPWYKKHNIPKIEIGFLDAYVFADHIHLSTVVYGGA